MAERKSNYNRVENDWYCEPRWAVEALRDRIQFLGEIHDPCCGMGTIPDVFKNVSTGADLIDRGFGWKAIDFLDDPRPRANIVTNPPYGREIIGKILSHAFAVALDRVAVLVQLSFLASQSRHALFENGPVPVERVIIFSRRPSMPPGTELVKHGEEIRGGGSKDYCWIIWRKNHRAPPIIEWAL